MYIYTNDMYIKKKVKLRMSNQKYKRKECKKRNGNDPKM